MPMDSSAAELRAFDATARLGSMSAAARQLGLSQPTVSGHIAGLERRFGVELFFRRGRRVELTGFGRVLQESTHRMFRAELDALASLREARSQYLGHLHVCAVGPYNVTPMLKRFRERWPAVHLTVSVGDSTDIVERVIDYRGDLGVLVHAVSDPRIHCVPFRRQTLIVLAPRSHPVAGRGSVSLADLRNQEFVMREVGSTTRSVFEHGLTQAGVQIRVTLEIGSRESVKEAVAQGLGLGVVADAAFTPDPRIVALPITGVQLHTHSHVICRVERRPARLIACFLSVVDELRPAAGAA